MKHTPIPYPADAIASPVMIGLVATPRVSTVVHDALQAASEQRAAQAKHLSVAQSALMASASPLDVMKAQSAYAAASTQSFYEGLSTGLSLWAALGHAMVAEAGARRSSTYDNVPI